MGDAPMIPPARVGTTVLGFPRLGRDRELKFALEAHWRGEQSRTQLEQTATAVRAQSLAPAAAAGLDTLPTGDQCLYDQVLDAILTFGLIPPRFGELDPADPATEFILARGDATRTPLEMTKWFDTNYHNLVPELGRTISPTLNPQRHLDRLAEGLATGVAARPVVVGPYTLLALAKPAEDGAEPLAHIDSLVPLYRELIERLVQAGAAGVQIDEPALVLRPALGAAVRARGALEALTAGDLGAHITQATYFGSVGADLGWLTRLPLHRLHLDLVRAPEQLEPALAAIADGGRVAGLSLGLINGRNIWRTDLPAARALALTAREALGDERITIATSCSLAHVPYSAAGESALDPALRARLAFADEKVAEVRLLAASLDDASLLADAPSGAAGGTGVDVNADPRLEAALAGLAARAPFAERYPRQQRELGLPALPTTTIGSFPQTDDLRTARRQHREGQLDDAAYRAILVASVQDTIARQEQIGLDLLVHGEPERNDMVEHFADQLTGIAFTANGWVQSYGSRGVKPPIIHGDVDRRGPMTVEWWKIAQAATDRPVKGMLTGPITMLQWSFVREDIPREEVANQMALALRDEVLDLEVAGCRAIQMDEPGLREGLPLDEATRAHYLDWAVRAFRIATAGVADTTQIHTHMCYADFDEIVDAVAALDADVISIEASRSGMEPLEAFGQHYPNAIGPGVYDIHSPRVPTEREMVDLLTRAARHIAPERLWANPDCGLKTRRWEEVTPALTALVAAARSARAALVAGAA